MLKSNLNHDILILTEQWVGGNAKITTMHDILILTEPVGWWEC
jgi:hypothetical protein